MAVTSNSRGETVSGSKVKIKNCDVIYDVGEVTTTTAVLYKNGKLVGKFPIADLILE